MDMILEVIFDLVAEGIMEVLSSRKVPMAIRIVLGVIVGAFVLLISFGMLFFGVSELFKGEIAIGILFLLLGLFFLVMFIFKGIRLFRKK